MPYNRGMDANDTPKKPADFSTVKFGTGKPKEHPRATNSESKPLTHWDIAWSVFAGLTFFYWAVKLFG